MRDTGIILVSALLFGHLLFGLLPSVFETWNAQAFDQLFVLRASEFPSRIPYDSTIVHVDETDSTVQALTGSYLTRQQYAQVVRNLGEMKTALQIWDYIFRAPASPEEDQYFFECNRKAGNAYYGLAFSLLNEPPVVRPPRPETDWEYLSRTKWYVRMEGDPRTMYVGGNPILTFPELASSARGLGYLSLRIDRDGVFRRAPLLVRYEDAYYPSFAFRAVCDYLHVTPDRVVVRPGTSIILEGAWRPGGEPHDITIPVDARCNLTINFVGPWRGSMTHYQFATVYHLSDDRDAMENDWMPLFQGKIAVVSVASTGAADVAPVPTDNDFPLSGVHANVINTILTENFLRDVGSSGMLVVELITLGLVGLFALQFSSRGMWVGAILIVVGYIVAAVALFLYGNVILNIVRPVLINVLAVFAVLAYRFINEEREKETLRQSFEAYLPPTVVKRMLQQPESAFEVQKKTVTILFSDIKSFTTYSSTMTPDQIQKMLDEYFTAMVDIVFKYEGTVDKYIGDGLMVFFGAPEPQPDHALRCVRAAIEMQRKCRELKEQWVVKGLFPLRVRVGINTGDVVVGNMGTRKKLSYTVLGSDVNLANRLESNAPVEGILISERTWQFVKDQVPTRRLEPILVKGLETPIQVYEVLVEDAPTAS